jgi:dTDP-4-dehydrorhamnose reductase
VKALLFGAGQLGQELARTCPDGVDAELIDRDRADITDAAAVGALVDRLRPGLIINAAAYTAVDRAEVEREAAYAVNDQGAGNVAAAAARAGARLVHVSTDFVFDGRKGRPYLPQDPPRPLSVYGASKRAGESRVLAGRPDAVIVRSAWLYAAHGSNFVHTMLRLMGQGEPLRVVADQVGSPTWARPLAQAIWRLALNPAAHGLQHWSDDGVASWYDFAVAIQEEALALGLLATAVPITPIRTEAYPTPATRPAFSVLDCAQTRALAGLEGRHWRVALRAMLAELAARN